RISRFGLVALAALTLAACGSGGQSAAPNGEEHQAGHDLNISVVVHADPDNTFWRVVKRGAQDAAAEYGVDLNVVGDGEGSKQAQLIEAELAKNPDGLVVSMANPDALEGALKAADSAGVPFITINSGADRSAAF